MTDFLMGVLVVLTWLVAALATGASYRNGVNDGYGFSKEPNNPGYKRAGVILRRYGKLNP